MDQIATTPSAQLLALALQTQLRVRFRVDRRADLTVHLQLGRGLETLEWALPATQTSLSRTVDRLAVSALRHCGHLP